MNDHRYYAVEVKPIPDTEDTFLAEIGLKAIVAGKPVAPELYATFEPSELRSALQRLHIPEKQVDYIVSCFEARLNMTIEAVVDVGVLESEGYEVL